MKQLLIFLSFILIITIGCDKENTIVYESTGLILGEDLRECGCCGGCFLYLDGDNREFLVDEFPTNFTCPNDSTSVKLNWTLVNDCSRIQRIIVDDIELN